MEATAELDQLGDSLTAIISSLRGLRADARDEDATLAATLSNVIDGLGSIRSSVGDIRRIVAEWRKEAADGGAITADLPTATLYPPRFHANLNVCATSCREVLQRLDCVVSSPSPSKSKGDVYDDSDWDSVAETVGGRSIRAHDSDSREDLLLRVEAVVGPLGGALGILLGVAKARDLSWSDQQGLLDNSGTREIFRRLEQSVVGLTPKPGGKGRQWDSLLKPFRALGGSSRLQTKPSKPSLSRAKTWPILLKLPVDIETDDARKRSARIDKQLEADAIANRNKCSVLLAMRNREGNILLTDTFATISSKADGDAAEDLPSKADSIRRRIQNEAYDMVSASLEEDMLSERDIHVNLELSTRLQEDDAIFDPEVVQLMEELWSSQAARAARGEGSSGEKKPVAYDNLVMDAFRRASAKDYCPTLEDHRRWYSHRPFHGPYHETFSFDSDSVAISVLIPKTACGHKTGNMMRMFIEASTSIIFLIDLTHYAYPLTECPGEQTMFTHNLLLFAAHFTGRNAGSHRSAIVIFYNVDKFREKLRRKPLSEFKVYRDYTGGNDPREVISYMIRKFREACKDKTRVYPHVGELTDPSTVKFIVAAAKESMLHSALKETGLF